MNCRERRRQRRAMRHKRILLFTALLATALVGLQQGVKGGGVVQTESQGMDSSVYRVSPMHFSVKERHYVPMMLGRIEKAHEAVMILLGYENFNPMNPFNLSFYQKVSSTFTSLNSRIEKALPAYYRAKDVLVIFTYIIYCAMYDYAALENDTRPELKKLINLLGTLADYLIPEDSPLVDPMNTVYWATREELQQTTDFTCGGRIEWLPSELEKKRNAA